MSDIAVERSFKVRNAIVMLIGVAAALLLALASLALARPHLAQRPAAAPSQSNPVFVLPPSGPADQDNLATQ